ncbi:MAG: amino acid adenylation domain-containing protein [Eubacteriaceae bacterium]
MFYTKKLSKTALVYGDLKITYKELYEKSHQLAAVLAFKGIGSGDIVAIKLPRSIMSIVAMIGCIKAGCAFANLELNYPKERLDYILSHCNPKLVIDVDFMENYEQLPMAEYTEASKDDLGALVYTSGSTGKPKGVMLSHDNLRAMVKNYAPELFGSEKDSFLLMASTAFVAYIFFVLMALSKGMTLHLAETAVVKDTAILETYLKENGISVMFAPPRVAKLLNLEKLPLNTLMVGSEKVHALDFPKKLNVINLYGLSETSGGITFYPHIQPLQEIIPIGKPLDAALVYILDENLNKCQQGQICVGGQSLSMGYYKQPELTKERFIDNPFAEGKLLLTGDLGKYDENQNIIYLNRNDWMINIAGNRVEPGEVESVLANYNQITGAAVKAFEDEKSQQPYMVAYYTGQQVETALLKKHILSYLPPYMLPSYFVHLETFPLNMNNKLDRSALMPPSFNADTAYVPPQNEIQKDICVAFETVLNLPKIGINHDFFNYGGDSIKAMELQLMLSKYNFSTASIFEGKTPEKIALLKAYPPLEKAPKSDYYPLTYSEQQMFVLQELSNDTAYNVSVSFTLRGFNTNLIKNAFVQLTKRYESLSSIYKNVNGELRHIILEDFTPFVTVKQTTPQQAISDIKDFKPVFNLSRPPLCYFSLYSTGEKEAIVNLTMHHIIIDGISINVLLKDFWDILNDEPLKDLSFKYTDYAVWLDKHGKDILESDRQYWLKVFENGAGEFELPLDFKRPTVLPTMNLVKKMQLEPNLFKKLERFSKQNNTSVFSVMAIANSLLLKQYSGSDQFVIGVPYNAKPLPETVDMVGVFVNTLPVLFKPDSKQLFMDYLDTCKDNLISAFKHSLFSLEELSKNLSFERDPSRNPVFDVLFNFLEPQKNYDNASRSLCHLPLPVQQSAFDMAMEVISGEDTLDVHLQFSDKLFKPSTIDRMLEQYEQILTEICDVSRSTTIKDLMHLTSEQTTSIESFNATDCEFPKVSYNKLFESIVKKNPDKLAVVTAKKSYTFKQLDENSNKIANKLLAAGVEIEDNVAFMLPRCPEVFFAQLGIMKAGAAFIPIDPEYPKDRIDHVLNDSNARFIITTKDFGEMFCFQNALILDDLLAYPDTSIPDMRVTPENLAYLIYTSGSTGLPKGAMIEHHSLVNYVANSQYNSYVKTLTEKCKVFLSVTTVAFDAFIVESLLPFANAKTVAMADEETSKNPVALGNFIEKNGVNGVFFTPSRLMEFVNNKDFCRALKEISILLLGGEKFPPGGFEQLRAFTDAVIINGYGPTETTVASNYKVITGTVTTIGKPQSNYKMFIVDKDLSEVPIGVPGELIIGGTGVCRGYLNRDELTAEKFITYKGVKAYRTGDLCRFTENGEVDIIGRIDNQVKLRGLRIELSEIESQISSFEGIKNVVVLVKTIGSGEHLCAYIVGTHPIDIGKLKEFLGKHLTKYMIPDAYIQMDHFPISPSGKINIKGLPQPEVMVGEMVAPATDIQKTVFKIFSNILKTDAFGVTDNLFGMGLTSLLAIRAVVDICEELNVNINANAIIGCDNILEIETLINAASGNTQTVSHEKLEYYPLNLSGQGVYMACQKDPEALIYNIPMCLKMLSKVNVHRLRESCVTAINAHPYLKVYLKDIAGDVFVKRNDEAPPVVTLKTDNEENINQLLSSFAKPFDLYSGPLYRIEILTTESAVYLLCDIHHLISDGGSMQILIEDIITAYHGHDILPEKYSTFDYFLDEKCRIENGEIEKQLEFYNHLIKGEMSSVPADLNGQGIHLMQKHGVLLPKASIDVFSKVLKISPNVLFMSALAYTLRRYTDDKEIAFSTISNGREDSRLSRNVGMFVKTLVFPITVESSVPDFIKSVSERFADIKNNDLVPFYSLKEKFGISPQINYAYQVGVLPEKIIEGEELELMVISDSIAKFNISVQIFEQGDCYKIELQYDSSLYSFQAINTFGTALKNAVLNLQNHTGDIKGLSLLDDAMRQQLEAINKTQCPINEYIVPKIFERIVTQNKDKTALIARDKTLSFDQLNRLSNRVANKLNELGVRPDDCVAVLLKRTSKLHCALFGILKSGAAFVPLDPEYPNERILNILEDSNASFIITENGKGFDNAIGIDELLSHCCEDNLNVPISKDNLCYIIYTSGSTGKPKGVMLEHKGLSNYCSPTTNNVYVKGITENATKLLSITTVTFDVFLKENMVALLNGLSVVLADEQQVNDPLKLKDLFVENQCDAFSATPSRLLQYLEVKAFRDALKNARFIICGGEKYPPKLYSQLRPITSGVLFNSYGPTEISISSNAKELKSDNITIGKPLSNVFEYIVDSDFNPLPIGMVGELLIGGMGVARGYIKNEELTAKSFINYQSNRVYRSGDFAKFNPDGEVIILGRMDNQIKLNGLRIELSEIEYAINRYPGINQCVVLIKEFMGAERLCAYFTGAKPVDISKLIDFISKALTSYMVPSAFLQMDAFPQTDNGKTDQKSLPMPMFVSKNKFESPENQLEKDLCTAFEQTLGLETVGALDNFFDIGGTSLLVTMLTVRADGLGHKISYADVFKSPTPRELAKLLSETQATGAIICGCRQQEIFAYDYSNLEKNLIHNTTQDLYSKKSIELSSLGDVFLTGATGYLGMHILKSLIDNHQNNIYCHVRGKNEERLKIRLVYYFSDSFDALFNQRIFVVGDDDFADLAEINIDTIINCAASVKHFSAGNEIEDANIDFTNQLIRFAQIKNARLIQVSTHSIAGMRVNDVPSKEIKLHENELFIGQDLENKYIFSKFIGERNILEAMTEGLDAKIMRVGNLMARETDGEFQINFYSNAFAGRLAAYVLVGAVPYSILDKPVEFAPIDNTADAILLLARTPKQYTIFHPYNNHEIFMADVFFTLKQKGISLEYLPDVAWKKACNKAMQNEKIASRLSPLIAYADNKNEIESIPSDHNFTTNILYRLGFNWSMTGERYLDQLITNLMGLGFFKA